MKTIKIFFFASLVGLFACQLSFAQTTTRTRVIRSERYAGMATPTVTQKYTNDQIRSMLMQGMQASSSDVMPSATLVQRFMTDFPQASDIEWELGGGIYEVEFEVGSIDHKAYYDAEGELLGYRYDLRRMDVPTNVRNVVDGRYPGYRYDDVEWVRAGSDTFYRLKLERGGQPDVKMMVKTDGTIMTSF